MPCVRVHAENGCHVCVVSGVDVLFGLLKPVLRARPDLRVIVTSATLDTTRFAAHFNNCPIYAVPGRMFPVDVCYATKDPKRTCALRLSFPV